jgi:hypothetical protein
MLPRLKSLSRGQKSNGSSRVRLLRQINHVFDNRGSR